jgi:hypothetical protein
VVPPVGDVCPCLYSLPCPLKQLCTALQGSASYAAQPPAGTGRWKDRPPVNPRYEWDVFISHAGKDADKPFATHLCRLLGQDGIGLRVFLDEDAIHVGGDGAREMDAAMKASQAALLLLSWEFFDREATLYELDFLIRRQRMRRIKLVPVFLRMTFEECAAELENHAAKEGTVPTLIVRPESQLYVWVLKH